MKLKFVAGGVLVFLGTAIALSGASDGNQSMINAGIGGVFLGIVLFTFSTSDYVKKDSLMVTVSSYTELARKLVSSLRLESGAVFIPPYPNLPNGGLFIPLYNDFEIDLGGLDEDTVFITDVGREREMGLLLPPPGHELVKRFEEYSEIDLTGQGVHAAENSYSVLRSLGLAKSVTIGESGNRIVIHLAGVPFMEQCSETCRQIPCPICGSVLLAISKSIEELIQVEGVEISSHGVVITATRLGGVGRWM